jgi:hypothetical protein
MAKNRRKSYDDYLDDAGSAEGIPCADCGCRHSYVVRTEKIGATVRRTRRCRHCGRTFYTTEAA